MGQGYLPRCGSRRRQPDPVFVGLDFLGDADLHGELSVVAKDGGLCCAAATNARGMTMKPLVLHVGPVVDPCRARYAAAFDLVEHLYDARAFLRVLAERTVSGTSKNFRSTNTFLRWATSHSTNSK